MKLIHLIVLFSWLCVCNAVHAGPVFDGFKSKQQQLLQEFGSQNLKDFKGHVFYPFGGPDVTYPLLMFPDLDTLTLVGLERAVATEASLAVLDNRALSNLSSLYKRSFFITDQMQSGLTNVTPLIVKQLENLGATEIKVAPVEAKANAVQIKCMYNAKERTIHYYKTNLDNNHIDMQFLKGLNRIDVAFFKAASYLPHQKNFSLFRRFVLENVQNFVQDSTGVPYEHLKTSFDLNLYGQYLKPYKFPGGFEQNSLRKYSESLNKPKLSFSFGYGGGFVPTNVLVAKRKDSQTL
jgi:hypothetical protein